MIRSVFHSSDKLKQLVNMSLTIVFQVTVGKIFKDRLISSAAAALV